MDIFQIGLSPRRAKTKSLVQAIWLVRVGKKAHVNITNYLTLLSSKECVNSSYVWWCHAFSGNIKTRLGGEDFAGIQHISNMSTWNSTKWKIDKTKVTNWFWSPPSLALALRGYFVTSSCISAISNRHVRYVLYSSWIPANLHHQVSFWCYQ